MNVLRLLTGLAPYLVILFQLSSVLSQFHSDRQHCAVPLNTSENTLTEAVLTKKPCAMDYSACNVDGIIIITTDKYSYQGATSTVHVNLTAKDSLTTHYYTLCSQPANSVGHYQLIECLARNESQFDTEVYWNETGLHEMTVTVYNDSSYSESDFVDCAYQGVLVANNSGLELNVTIFQQKPHNIIPPPRSKPDPVIPVVPSQPVAPTCNSSLNSYVYEVGNITFTASVNFTNRTVVFSYDFGDGTFYNRTKQASKLKETHYYKEAGTFNYSVHALVVLKDREQAVHTSKESHVQVFERVTDPLVSVGDHNSVQVGVSYVHLQVSGSFPVKFCWCMVFPNSTTCSQLPIVNSISKANITCTNISNNTLQPLRYPLNLTLAGTHRIIANFSNMVGCYNGSYSFFVSTPPSPNPIIVSSATVGVLAALLAFTIIVIIVIVTVVIPYRRYKYRMTETANFKFVELSESTGSIKGKMRRSASSLVNIFKSNRDSRVGLVNTDHGTLDGSSNRLIGRPNSKVVTFANYDSL